MKCGLATRKQSVTASSYGFLPMQWEFSYHFILLFEHVSTAFLNIKGFVECKKKSCHSWAVMLGACMNVWSEGNLPVLGETADSILQYKQTIERPGFAWFSLNEAWYRLLLLWSPISRIVINSTLQLIRKCHINRDYPRYTNFCCCLFTI